MPKLLGEFLQEQQEPFVLDVYLVERRAARFCSQKKTPRIPNCGDFVRALFTTLVFHRKTREEEEEEEDYAADDQHYFSATSNSCSESDAEEPQFNTTKSNSSHELSPVSVLQDTESPKQYNFKKTQGESSKLISKCKSTHKSIQDFEEGDYCYDLYSINKRALHQTKQLLVDCVREVVEDQKERDDGKGQQLKKILGAEELWKLVCENVWLWSQEPIDETNIFHLLNSDFMASFKERDSASAQQKYEISMEIGDAILEDIINEIVTC